MAEVNGKTGEWVEFEPELVNKGDIVRYTGVWSDDNPPYNRADIRINDDDTIERFVPDRPKLSDLPNGSIVGLGDAGGGFYTKDRRGTWWYFSVMFGEVSAANPDEAGKKAYVIREGEEGNK